MSKKIKVCLYWISVVLPIFDIITGVVNGVATVFTKGKEDLRQLKEQKERERFKNDNE